MLQQVLDLDRHVVGEPRELAREHASDDPTGVRRSVEEIGIAKRDVLRAACDLRAHVGCSTTSTRNRAEPALVHRDDRTVPAQMLAAPGRLGAADDRRVPSGIWSAA